MNRTQFEEQLNQDALETMEEIFTCLRNNFGNDEEFVEVVINIRNKHTRSNAFIFEKAVEDCLEDSIEYHADNITIYYSTVSAIFNDCYPYSQEIQDQDDDSFNFEYDRELTYGENVDKIQAFAVYRYYRNKQREIIDSMIDDEERFYGILAQYILSNQGIFTPNYPPLNIFQLV